MNKFSIAALAAAIVLPAAVHAAEFKKGELVVEEPWARASAMSARNGAAFMVISNNGKESDRLVKASADVSEVVELHTHLMEDGVMKMRKIDGIDVDPGAPAVLKPGSLHIMLINLKAPLKEGSKFPLTLTFQKGGDMVVEATVSGAGAMGPMGGMGGMGGMKH